MLFVLTQDSKSCVPLISAVQHSILLTRRIRVLSSSTDWLTGHCPNKRKNKNHKNIQWVIRSRTPPALILFSLTWQTVKILHIDPLHNLHAVTALKSPMGSQWAICAGVSEKFLFVIKSPRWPVCQCCDDGALLPHTRGELVHWNSWNRLSQGRESGTCACHTWKPQAERRDLFKAALLIWVSLKGGSV